MELKKRVDKLEQELLELRKAEKYLLEQLTDYKSLLDRVQGAATYNQNEIQVLKKRYEKHCYSLDAHEEPIVG